MKTKGIPSHGRPRMGRSTTVSSQIAAASSTLILKTQTVLEIEETKIDAQLLFNPSYHEKDEMGISFYLFPLEKLKFEYEIWFSGESLNWNGL